MSLFNTLNSVKDVDMDNKFLLLFSWQVREGWMLWWRCCWDICWCKKINLKFYSCFPTTLATSEQKQFETISTSFTDFVLCIDDFNSCKLHVH